MSIGFGKIVRQIWNRFRPFVAFESVSGAERTALRWEGNDLGTGMN